MKQLFSVVALFLLVCKGAYGQQPDSRPERWTMGVNFEPAYTNRSLHFSRDNTWVQELRDEQEVPAFGFSTGLSLQYVINAHWSIEGGFQFANRAYATKKQALTWTSMNENYPLQSKTRFAYHYIEIPVKLNYHWKAGEFDMYFSTGISLNNFINKRTSMTTFLQNGSANKENNNHSYGYNSDTYSSILGLGIHLPLSERLLFNFEPTYRQHLTLIVDDKNAREYFHTLGMNTKLLLRL